MATGSGGGRSVGDKARDKVRLMKTEQGRADVRYMVSRRWLNPLLQPLGFVVVADHFYQPLLSDRSAKALGRRSRMPASFRETADASSGLLDEILAAHSEEFFGPDGPGARFGYTEERSQLGPGDQEVLFAYIRHTKPRRVVEVGAGGSTLIISAALALNADDASFVSIEPYPADWLLERLDAIQASINFEFHPTFLQDADHSLFEGLGAGDVLFIDSSHVYRPGSDVEYEFLDVYPSLAPGVIVHIHDIFLPDDYPAAWNLHNRRYWNEQYVLEAVLASTDRFEPVLPLASLSRTHRSTFERHLPGFTPDREPGSIWLRIND